MKSSTFWKSQQFWWVPILVLFIGAIGWLIKFNMEQSQKLGWLVGNVSNITHDVTISLEGSEYGIKTAKFPNGFFRFNEIHAGRHQIEFNHPGYKPLFENVKIYGGKENEFITSFPEAINYEFRDISELYLAVKDYNTVYHVIETTEETRKFDSIYRVKHFVAPAPRGYRTISKDSIEQDIDSIVYGSNDTFSIYLKQLSVREIDTVFAGNSEIYFEFYVEGRSIGESRQIAQSLSRNTVKSFQKKGLYLSDLRLPLDYNFNLRIDFYLRNTQPNGIENRNDLLGRFFLTFGSHHLAKAIGPIFSGDIPHYGARNSSLNFTIE